MITTLGESLVAVDKSEKFEISPHHFSEDSRSSVFLNDTFRRKV
jgi:hypothetical protein